MLRDNTGYSYNTRNTMIVHITNKIVTGDYAYYDANFYRETENGLTPAEYSLGGMVFGVNDDRKVIESRIRESFTGLYPVSEEGEMEELTEIKFD